MLLLQKHKSNIFGSNKNTEAFAYEQMTDGK